VGDTITIEFESRRAEEALPGYAEAKPMVWCGMFPTDAADYDNLRDALSKLKLNDAALQVSRDCVPNMLLMRCQCVDNVCLKAEAQ